MYQSYQANNQLVNIVSVDNQFDFSQEEELISGRSYMSRIIMEQPNFLYNFTNLGYQSYYIAQEELDLMEKLHFDSLRLGALLDDISKSEPFFKLLIIFMTLADVLVHTLVVPHIEGFVVGKRSGHP